VRLTRAAFVPDGLSHTVAFSERLRGTGQRDQPEAERDAWALDVLAQTARVPEVLDATSLYSSPGWTGFALVPYRPSRLRWILPILAVGFATALLVIRALSRRRGEARFQA
jgi:hypothetical protein